MKTTTVRSIVTDIIKATERHSGLAIDPRVRLLMVDAVQGMRLPSEVDVIDLIATMFRPAKERRWLN